MIQKENYEKIYYNALDHIETAQEIAGEKRYGFAISHLILGMEELIKYHVMSIHISDNNNSEEKKLFTSDEINSLKNSIFRKHSTKHKLIKEFEDSLTPEFGNKFREYILKTATQQNICEGEYSEIINNRFKETGSFLSFAFREMNQTNNERVEFSKWFIQVNNYKNIGLYVDWQYDKWNFPTDLKESNYQFILKGIMLFKNYMEKLKNLDLTEDDFMDLLNRNS